MRAVTWQGKRDVRVTDVPDPAIEDPTDIVVRITSSGICGSDLHLYEVMGAYIDAGGRPRPRADGERRGGRARGHGRLPRRSGRRALQHLVRHLLHARGDLLTAVPALQALAAAYPGHERALACPPVLGRSRA